MKEKDEETIKKEIEKKINKLKKTDKKKYDELKKITKKDNWINDIQLQDLLGIFKSLQYMDRETLEYYKNGVSEANKTLGGKNE